MGQERVVQFFLKVKVFGLFREALGSGVVEIALDAEATVADLRKQLSITYPQLSAAETYFIITVNRRVAPDTAKIGEEDEIAIMPLVSGG